MWWRSLIAALMLAACGFTPVYGPGGGGALLGTFEAREPTTQAEFAFVDAFEARLGLPNAPRFDLSYRLTVTNDDGRAITGSNDITRFTVRGTLAFDVLPYGTPEAPPLLSGSVQGFTSYSASGSSIATFQARRDAEERLMQILADRLAERLTAASEVR